MEEQALKIKERYLLAELGVSFALLVAAIFLFGQALKELRPYLILGLAGGFSFSWSFRNRKIPALPALINIAVAVVFVWVFYALFNSSLFYKEVILLFIKGGFILAVLLSFGVAVGFLAYVEVLGLPLFLCFPLFVTDYNSGHYLLIALCFICLAALLKLKFEGSFVLAPAGLRRHYTLLLGAALLLLITVLAWIFFSLMPVPTMKEGGFFVSTGEEYLLTRPSEQKYYELQERLQEKILNAMPDFQDNEDKSEVLLHLSSLIKDSADVMEVKKAKDGLNDQLRRPGAGMEEKDSQEITILLEKYVGEKIAFNLKKYKESINENLKGNPFSIRERISVLSRANRIQYGNSAQRVESYAKEIKEVVNKSNANPAAKRELKENLREFQEWKNLELYYRQLRAFKKKVASRQQEDTGKLDGLTSAIEKINDFTSLRDAKGKARILKYTEGRSAGDLVSEAEGVINIASRILLSRSIGKAKGKLSDAGLSTQELQKKEERFDAINSMEEYQKFEQGSGAGEKETRGSIQNQKRLVSIELIPEYCKMPLGQERELLALGIYEDNSRQDLTDAAEWSSTDKDIVSVAVGKITGFRIGEAGVYAESEGIKSRPVSVVIESPQLASIKILPGDLAIPINGGASLKAEGTFTNGDSQDITSLVTWKNLDNRIVSIARGEVQGLRIGRTSAYAEYSGVKSAPINIRVIVTVIWLLLLLMKITLSLTLFLSLLLAVLYVLTEDRRKRIKAAMFSADLRGFIIGLYENTRGILTIFGPRCQGVIPPLSYASMVEESYYMSDNLYLGFTRLFEEAKYSNHPVGIDDAERALDNYNAFIRILLGRQNKSRLFLRYCLALILRRPLYI